MITKKKLYALFIIVLFFSPNRTVLSQSYLQFQASKGQLAPFRSDVGLSHHTGNMLSLDYATVLKGKEYHEYLHNPQWGVSLSFIDYEDESLGFSLASSTFLQLNVLSLKRHSLNGRLSVGLAYVQNPFDPIENSIQHLISTKLNFFVESTLIYLYDLSPKLDLTLQGGLNHMSNAAKRLPNTGLNMLFLGVGTNYRISEESHIPFSNFNRPEIDYAIRKFSHYAFVRAGIKSIENQDYNFFPAVGFNYTVAYRYHPIGSVTGGLDVDYNRGYIEHARNRQSAENIPFNKWRWGAAIGHELHMNRLSLITQYGRYIREPHEGHKKAYQRYGLKYRTGKHTNIALTLRAHGGSGDYMEYTFGWRF